MDNIIIVKPKIVKPKKNIHKPLLPVFICSGICSNCPADASCNYM